MRHVRLLVGALSILALVAAACAGQGEPTGPGAATPASKPVPSSSGTWTPEAGKPFAEPAELVSEDGELKATLEVSQQAVTVSGSTVLDAKAYNGGFVAPTLVLEPGDVLELDLVNGLDQPTNMHFHGFHTSPDGDSDNIFRHVEPGETAHFTVEVPQNHEQGLFWYHSHAHGISDQQVAAGMSGLIRIGNVADLLPYRDTDLVTRDLAIRDLQVKGDKAPTSNDDLDPKAETVRLINGQVQPEMSMKPGEMQLWRIGNIGADQFYDLQLEGHTFHVVGEDGNPVGEVWSTKHLVLPPGKRYEVLVKAGEAGRYELKTLKYDQGFQLMPEEVMATVKVDGPQAKNLELPETVGSFEDLAKVDDIAARRTETFSFAPGKEFRPQINGTSFDMDVVNVTTELGTVEEWTLRNTTDEQHPFHIHVNDFQVMSVDGKSYDAKGTQDTVIIPAGGEVVIRIPFDDYPGRFVFHCHILGHEDAGMMAVIEVK